jgi:putative ABC transport system permease protein
LSGASSMKILRFALKSLWRDWRGGDLGLLAFALVLAVAAVTSVGFFTDRVDQALQQQGNELLAADLVIESADPLPELFAEQAATRGLRRSRSLSFPSVLLNADGPQLVQVKAVDDAYPLRGQLLLRTAAAGIASAAPAAPANGRLWVEPRLLTLLGSELGQSVRLGDSELVLDRLIAFEPDRGGNLFQLAPRVMLHIDGIPATGLVTAASRVRHRFMLAGDRAAIADYRHWASTRLPRNASILGIDNARPELRAALDRGSRFLSLAALVTVIVTGAAIALATRRMLERQADSIAVLRCLGAASGFLRLALLLKLLLLVVIASLLGALLGFGAQTVLSGLIGDWLTQGLPAPSPAPLLSGFATALLSVFGFALPALWRLPAVPPLRVLRHDLGPTPPGPWTIGLGGLGALSLLLFWQAGDAKLAAGIIGGVLGLLIVLAMLALLLVKGASIVQRRASGVGRFGLAALSRHPATTVLQVCGFGLGIMAMLLLAIVRVDLLSAWERSLPEQTPNRFLINILPEQAKPLQALLAEQQITGSGLHPMVRARLTRINERAVRAEDYTESRAQRLATREFNLSWAMQPQPDNQIIAGRWWADAHDAPQFSVEAGIAKTLGIDLGDTLTYWLGGQEISAPVTSLRSVQWDSFNVNFFVIGTPSLLREAPTTYVASFYLPPEREELAVILVKRFPNVTVLDVSSLLAQVKSVMARGSAAVEYVFLFTLAAGLLVLYAGIQAGAASRRREAAILRTLGARRSQLLGAAAVEFGVLGLLAGVLASLGASLTGQFIARQVFQLDYGFEPWLWVIGSGSALVGIGLAGLAATWPLVVRPPLQSLRQAS